jgi:hypothetical protein
MSETGLLCSKAPRLNPLALQIIVVFRENEHEEEHWWNNTDKVTRTCFEKILCQFHLVHYDSCTDCSPNLNGEKSETKGLNHGRAN